MVSQVSSLRGNFANTDQSILEKKGGPAKTKRMNLGRPISKSAGQAPKKKQKEHNLRRRAQRKPKEGVGGKVQGTSGRSP